MPLECRRAPSLILAVPVLAASSRTTRLSGTAVALAHSPPVLRQPHAPRSRSAAHPRAAPSRRYCLFPAWSVMRLPPVLKAPRGRSGAAVECPSRPARLARLPFPVPLPPQRATRSMRGCAHYGVAERRAAERTGVRNHCYEERGSSVPRTRTSSMRTHLVVLNVQRRGGCFSGRRGSIVAVSISSPWKVDGDNGRH
ncbi:hypothetical protein HYPSUDRAFT_197835 [Hypholoma sublateritium FD-334 SS-4]|uniref:Uncharacterized protein n=1 Tax=Hypholoma sublateritium (strain FD-334 SS-4) TaxID=945553 RepID=A0A0D2MUH7_HYPSF|nr:hypothetical protein HYPSUDRAFT_197835 [Hypholoma sublateritium FD-334 SS-4]